MGNFIPGDGNDNWKTQLRGNDGRWINMYGPVSFDYTPSGGGPAKKGQGTFQGVTSPGRANIFVKDDPELEVGMYEVQSQFVRGVKAFIPTSGGSAKPVKAIKPKPERRDSLSGSEVQERKLSTVTKNLRKEGRFSVPRQTTSNFWGEESDIAKGAKEDYNLVYEGLKSKDPSWAEKYPTFDDFWGKVKEMAVGQTSQSPNDLADIPQEMKDINRAYAENVLNMNPDGKITFYRNAVNRKGSAEDSALGYVTTNADFAYDYNSQAPNESGNGRYEIDAKPDEVFGMLGYSQLEDEFGVVVGRGVTSQPDRVRRVGDLAQPKLAPWLEKYQDGVGRSTGGTPYRHYALAGQFDLLPVDPLGDTLDEFLQKNGKTSADIKTKFDELYGEGAYEEYKASGNGLSFTNIKNMFVDAGNGKVGLDITKIEGGEGGSLAPGYYGSGDPSSFKNDKLDNTLKMLSTFQELSGQPFIVHRSRTDELPTKPKETPAATEAELESLFSYRKEGYKDVNKYLRDSSPDKKPSPKNDAVIADIDSLIEKQTPTTEQTVVYRGLSGPAAERLRSSATGDVFTEPAFSSTSTSQQNMWAFAYGTENVGAELHLTVPAGSKFVNVDDYIPETLGPLEIARETEALFPSGMKFRVDSVDGKVINATILPDSAPEPEQQEREGRPTNSSIFSDVSPTLEDEEKTAAELFETMVTNGVSVADIAKADSSFQNYPDKYKEDAEVLEGAAKSFVQSLMSDWNGSPISTDSMKALQVLASEEFGTAGLLPEDMTDKAKEIVAEHGDVYKEFIKAQYQKTQEFFASKGITEVKLYRGSRPTDSDEGSSKLRPLSSWSTNPDIADSFGRGEEGSELLEEIVPVSKIFSTQPTGLGVWNEKEVVVIGDSKPVAETSEPETVDAPNPEPAPETERKTGLFNEYSPERADEITAENTPLTDLGFDPEEEITIYRGVPEGVDSINDGDWVTTLPQLAKDYAGGDGKVVSSKVKAKDLLADPSSGEGAYTEEMVYRPKVDSVEAPKVREATSRDMQKEFSTNRDSSELKNEVTRNLLNRIFDKGITRDELIETLLSMQRTKVNEKLISDTGEVEPSKWSALTGIVRWEGTKNLSEVKASSIKTFVALSGKELQSIQSGSLGAALKNAISLYKIDSKQDDIPELTESMTYDEAITYIKKLNTLIDDKYKNDKDYNTRHAIVYEDNIEEAKDVISYSTVSNMVSEWAGSSNDENAFSLALQDTVAKLFSLENYQPWSTTKKTSDNRDAIIKLHDKVLRAYAEAQYEATQEQLKAKGITSVQLYRGMNAIEIRDALEEYGYLDNNLVILRPLSSFSYDIRTAESFAGDNNSTIAVTYEQMEDGPERLEEVFGSDFFETPPVLKPNEYINIHGEIKQFGAVVLNTVVSADKIFSMPFSGVGCLDESEVVVIGPNLRAEVIRPEDAEELANQMDLAEEEEED